MKKYYDNLNTEIKKYFKIFSFLFTKKFKHYIIITYVINNNSYIKEAFNASN